MRAAGPVVLDASALLALLRAEPGGVRVAAAIVPGALISALNWSEVLSRLVDLGGDPARVTSMSLPPAGSSGVEVVPFDDAQARDLPGGLRDRSASGVGSRCSYPTVQIRLPQFSHRRLHAI